MDIKRFVPAVALLALAPMVSAVDATIPSTGVDTGAFITAGILTMGGVAAVAVGGYFAFLVIKKGLAWAGKALG